MQTSSQSSFLRIVESPQCNPESIAAACGMRIERESGVEVSETWLDTWDGRLWRNGWRLSLAEAGRLRRLQWRHVSTGTQGEAQVRKVPRWREDLPAACGDLTALIDMRVLRDVAVWRGQRTTCAVLDDLAKTVVRLSVYDGALSALDKPTVNLPQLWTVSPLKGFADAAQALVGELDGMAAVKPCDDVLGWLADAGGLSPTGYSAGLKSTLSPQMSTGAAIAQLLAVTRAAVEQTRSGTEADLDSEFLHDLRVAVRRARSWLTRLKQWIDPATFSHLKTELGWLGGVTGPTRDLDVYLLKMPAYQASLPEADAAALAPLTAHLKRAQKRAQRKLREALRSERFAALDRSWAAFTNAPVPAAAQVPVSVTASAVIAKQWKRLRKRGRAIEVTTPAAALHDLRIECKKLRYLLEAFSSLYERVGMDTLIRGLKRLQDNLGDFQDLEVQQDALRDFAHALAANGADADTLIAIGRLVEKLDGLKVEERRRFGKRWSRFDSAANNAFARSAFAPQPKPLASTDQSACA